MRTRSDENRPKRCLRTLEDTALSRSKYCGERNLRTLSDGCVLKQLLNRTACTIRIILSLHHMNTRATFSAIDTMKIPLLISFLLCLPTMPMADESSPKAELLRAHKVGQRQLKAEKHSKATKRERALQEKVVNTKGQQRLLKTASACGKSCKHRLDTTRRETKAEKGSAKAEKVA
eukprot:scaffold9706_cov79-Skeletonema_dohrnii-CCMP3373.AAC.3